MGLDAVDDMHDHGHQDQEHTETDCYDEDGVQFSDEGNGHHVIHGLQPQGREHILETEEASVEESEDRGEETGAADDGC